MKNYIKTKLHWKETSKQFSVLINPKIIKKRYQNDHQILFFQKHHQNCIEVHWKDLDLSSIKIILKKVHRNDVDFFPIKITLKKIHRNNVDFSLIDIMSNKVRRNGVDFLPIKITSKRQGFFAYQNYIEKIRRNDVKIRRYFFRRIDVISTLNRRWFNVLQPLGKWVYFL